jgi:hypothetical protein
MLLRSLALAACIVPLLNLPAGAAAFSAVWTGSEPQFITVAQHGDDFDEHDARALARSMGYHVLDVDENRHGFVIIGVNHDGKWRLFIDDHGDVRSVSQIGGRHRGGHEDDD